MRLLVVLFNATLVLLNNLYVVLGCLKNKPPAIHCKDPAEG